MYPWTFVGGIEKCDRKWFIYHPALRIAKHSLKCIVKGFEHLIPIFFVAAEGSKRKKDKTSRKRQSNLNDNDIMCIINISLKI